MKLRRYPKDIRPYFINKKRLKKLSQYIIKEGKCLLCFMDVRIIYEKLKIDFVYQDYHRLIVFENEFYICKDCYSRFKEVTE